MRKKGSIYIVIAVITLALLMLLQYNRPKEVNWFPSYVSTHSIPYGTLVLNDMMKTFYGEKVRPVGTPPFAFLGDTPEAEGTYLFVNVDVKFGKTELDRLLTWAAKGNILFMAAKDFDPRLLDTLKLNTASLYGDFENVGSYSYRLVHPQLRTEHGYPFSKEDYATYFTEYDTEAMTVIGTVRNMEKDSDADEQFYNVIRCRFGNGKIILSTFPKAFTNYFILKDDNREYTAGLLSYLDGSRNIYIDHHYKAGKSVYTSPMYIFLNTKELKWAYYLVLIGALLYVIFEGKRKQRAIPVVLPLKNQTLAFTRTIADMYYEKGKAKPIAAHRIEAFLEYIRSRFHLGTIEREMDFYGNLASRSGHGIEEIQRLFAFLEQLRNQETVSDTELKALNASLEKFKKRAEAG